MEQREFAARERSILVAGTSGTRLGAVWTAAILDRAHAPRYAIRAASLGRPTTPDRCDVLVITALRSDELPADLARESAAARIRALIEEARSAVIVNGADPVAVGIAAAAARVPVYVTGAIDKAPLAEVRGDRLVVHDPLGGDAVLPVSGLRLASSVYAAVAATAIAAALVSGARLDAVTAIGDVQSDPELGVVLLGVRRHVRYFVDAGATTPGRVLAGVAAGTPGRTLLVAGGAYGGQPLARWGQAVAATRYVLLYGSAADSLADAARDRTTIVRCADLSDAVATATKLANRGDSVVYAPGCMPEHGTPRFEAERFAEAALGASLVVAA
jgi:UDP-N-acetylmuramoylalanine-D-glutamate ligase